MKVTFFYALCFIMLSITVLAQDKTDYSKLSQELLYAAKTDASTDSVQKVFAMLQADELMARLKSDAERKSFWLNIYNAYTQIRLKQNQGSYGKRSEFFTDKFILMARKNISLDIIEHGILRRSKAKLSLGYLNKLFKSKFEKQFRVNVPDYRIHFALNCGAKSCPPIAFYKPEQIEQQLDLAAKVFLKNEVMYDSEHQTVEVPLVMSWFRADFGGKKGILKILHKQGLIPANIYPAILWKKYDWTISLNAFE